MANQKIELCNSTLAFTGPGVEEVDCAKKMVEAKMEDLWQHV